MAIVIIGEEPREKHRTTCNQCASILEYTLNDTQEVTERDWGGGSDKYRYITCPKCSNRFKI